jgi:hypothetical protein
LDVCRAGFLKAHNIDQWDWDTKREVPEYMLVGKPAGVGDARDAAMAG